MLCDYWRDFDLTVRKQKIKNAFYKNDIKSAQDVPVIFNTGNYFGFGCLPRPKEYWEDPAVMLSIQSGFMERHLKSVRDDMVPYFMPWFGTGVLASAFGCEVKPATGIGDDPGVLGHIVHDIKQASELKRPNLTQDGLCPQVLRFMEYAMENGDLPVALTDLNSPMSTLAQVIGYENLFTWMIEEPDIVRELMALFTDTFVDWVKLLKNLTGEPLDSANALQGVWSPKGTGVWISDDDLISVGAELYAEFIVPEYRKLFMAFGGGSLHFCGAAAHHLQNFKDIGALTAINNCPMGKVEAFTKLCQNKPEAAMLQIQDSAPAEPENYYNALFSQIDDFKGMMVAGWVLDNVAMRQNGGYMEISWNSIEAANRMVDAIRAAIDDRLNKSAA